MYYSISTLIKFRRLGDQSMSVLEIWGAEYQENDALLILPEDRRLLEGICARERCLMQVQPWVLRRIFFGGCRRDIG